MLHPDLSVFPAVKYNYPVVGQCAPGTLSSFRRLSICPCPIMPHIRSPLPSNVPPSPPPSLAVNLADGVCLRPAAGPASVSTYARVLFAPNTTEALRLMSAFAKAAACPPQPGRKAPYSARSATAAPRRTFCSRFPPPLCLHACPLGRPGQAVWPAHVCLSVRPSTIRRPAVFRMRSSMPAGPQAPSIATVNTSRLSRRWLATPAQPRSPWGGLALLCSEPHLTVPLAASSTTSGSRSRCCAARRGKAASLRLHATSRCSDPSCSATRQRRRRSRRLLGA
jgi:hypothetical protein